MFCSLEPDERPEIFEERGLLERRELAVRDGLAERAQIVGVVRRAVVAAAVDVREDP